MDTNVVHFANVNPDGTVTPLCGGWYGGSNWTTLPDAVTCPECIRRLRERATRGVDVRARPPRIAAVAST